MKRTWIIIVLAMVFIWPVKAEAHIFWLITDQAAPEVGKPVQVDVISTGEERYPVSAEILDWLRAHPGVSNSWSSLNVGKDVIELDVNHALLAARGLTMEQLVRAMRVAVDGLLVDELQTLDERVRFRLQLPPSRAGRLETLENLAVINDRGEAVYLKSLARFELRPGEASWRYEVAVLLKGAGRIDEAHEQARLAARLAPRNGTYRALLKEINHARAGVRSGGRSGESAQRP